MMDNINENIIFDSVMQSLAHDIWQIDSEVSISSSMVYPYGMGKEWSDFGDTEQ